MNTRPHQDIPRRQFLGTTLKLAVLGTLIAPLEEACNSKKKEPGTDGRPPVTDKNKQPRGTKKPRTKWHQGGLVMNSKTGILHLPLAAAYTYYDTIKPEHLEAVDQSNWEGKLGEEVRFNKQQSGTILEILALQPLKGGVDATSLDRSLQILARAFSPACQDAKGRDLNERNFRLHELALQLIALHPGIADKWGYFTQLVKKPASLRKRQSWMGSPAAFSERTNYIAARQAAYADRLQKRANRYTLN